MSTGLLALLEAERAETALPDKKPPYTHAEARAEAERCLYCVDAPCVKACPTEIDIPTFIRKIATDNVRGSAATIFEQNVLGYSCARVCPVEVLCVGSCVYNGWNRDPIQIGRLQRYATEAATLPGQRPMFTPKPPTGRKVALIGGGPASLACAAYLTLDGHKAVIFEKRSVPGGLNTTGVAPYKLHAKDSLKEVEWLLELGVEMRLGVEIGKDITAKQLLEEYDAVYIGVGLGEDSRLGVPGEEGPGVVGATAWIEEMKLAKRAKDPLGRVAVIGGGNTAIDVAREAALLGAQEVVMIYRKGAAEMSGYAHEMAGARKEGVRLLEWRSPTGFERGVEGRLTGVRVAHAPTGESAAIEVVPCDLAVLAIGQSKLRDLAAQFEGVALDKRGCVVADAKNGQTGNAKVFSGGDCINGGKEVVNAVADGRNTARYLTQSWSTV